MGVGGRCTQAETEAVAVKRRMRAEICMAMI